MTAVITAAVASLGATAADAKVVTVTDDTAADFSQGAQSSTVVRAEGAVELARALEEQFEAAATLPTGWTSTPWDDPLGTSSVNGSLVVDGARADSNVLAGPGSSLQFRATLGSQTFSHVGFGIDFNLVPRWAMFSTGPDGGGKVYARVSSSPGLDDDRDFVVPDVVATDAYDYRIDWKTTGFDFYVNGQLAITHAVPMTEAMRPQASNFANGGGVVSVDSMVLRTHNTGTFTSRVIDAGDNRVTGLTFAATGTGTIAYETRTADSPTSFANDWQALAGGAVASPPKRYLQYRATLTTPDVAATPKLDKVDAAFTIDDQAPVVTIDDLKVTGASAKITFSRDDAAAKVECSLDGAAFADCTSPAEFGGLAVGSHSIAVRATDAHANVGTATRTFEVAAPSGGSGVTPQPGGGGGAVKPGATPDVTAPKVLMTGSSVRVSARGVAKLVIRCPRAEESCAVTVKLKLAGKRIARKTLMMSGGETRSFRLRLSKAARAALTARSQLKATAVITAEDAAGNDKTTTRRVTLRAPAL